MNEQEKMLMKILRNQERIRRRNSWWLDLSSNVAGNAIWDSAVWLASKLLRKL